MQNTTDIEALKDFLADEGQFPASKGFRNPSAPAFIFFDDDKELDHDVAAFRETLLDYEEWAAATNTIDSSTVKVGMFDVSRDIKPWNEREPDHKALAYEERQESRQAANWHIGHAKRRPKNNDHWRKLVRPLSDHLDNKECLTILKTMRDVLPLAPGPIKGTVFVNPDGSRFESSSDNAGAAKAAYIKRHGLKDTFVSVDRVQKEGEKHSKWVVGTRRESDKTPSNYYDPGHIPGQELDDNGKERPYQPCACNLYRIPASKVFEGHRLTIREFERAILSGAEIFDSFEETTAREFETTYLVDSRVTMLNLGYGSDGRDPSALTHEESYLYSVLQMFGEEQACELLLLQDQEPGMLASHFLSSGAHSDTLINILKWVDDQDKPQLLRTKHIESAATPFAVSRKESVILPPENESPMLPFVIAALTNRPVADIESRLDAKSVSRDNRRQLTKAADSHDYGFQQIIGNYHASW